MQNSVAKKIFAVGVAASTVLMGLAPLAAHAAAHAVGTNILTSDGTVWMVTSSGTRRAYTSAGAFLSYGFNSFSSVVAASADDLALPTDVAGFIPPQDGTVFCATATKGSDVKGECSLVTAGQKAAFTSAAVFTGLGFSFSRAQYGDSSFLSKTSNIDNTTDAHRAGVLVNNNGTVQLVGANGLLGIPDLATFNSWGYSFANVVPANAADKAMTQTGVMAARTPGQLSPTALAPLPPGSGNPPPVSGSVVVSAGSLTPASTVPLGATNVPFLKFVVSNNSGNAVTVSQITVHRSGAGATTDLSNVYVYQGSSRLTSGRSINSSTNDAVFSGLTVNVPAYGSVTLDVTADINTTGTGNVDALAVTSVMMGGVAATGTAQGNLMTLAGVTAGSITISDSGTITNPKVGEQNVKVAQFQLAAGTSEDLTVKRISLIQGGAVSNSNLSNFVLKQAGNTLASVASLDSKDKANFDLNFAMAKGDSKTFEVYANISGGARSGSAENIKFYLEENTDLFAVGSTYGFGVSVTKTAYDGQSCTSSTVNTDCSYSEIEGGTLTLTFNGPAGHDIAKNGKDVEVFNFTLAAQNNLEVRQMLIKFDNVSGNPDFGDGTTANYTDAKVIDTSSGAVVWGPQDLTASSTATSNTLTFPEDITLSAGSSKTFKVTMDIANNSDVTDGDKIRATLVMSGLTSSDVRNLDNNTYLTSSDIVPTSDIVGNEMTVKAVSLETALAATPTSKSIVKGTSNVDAAGFVFTASSGGSVKVDSITLTGWVASSTDTTLAATSANTDGSVLNASDDVVTVSLWDGSTQIGQTKSPAVTTGLAVFNSLNWVIPAGTSKTLTVKMNISNSVTANDVIKWVIEDGNITAVDVDGNEVTDTSGATTTKPDADLNGSNSKTVGTAITISGNGTITAAAAGTEEGITDARVVTAGASGVTLGKIRLTAVGEELKLTKVRINVMTASAGQAGAGIADDVSALYLYDGSTLVAGPVSLTPSGTTEGYADFNSIAPDFVIGKDLSKNLTVKANLNTIANGADSGDEFALNLSASNFEARGTAGSTIRTTFTGSYSGSYMVLRKSQPKIEVVPFTGSLGNGTQKLLSFKVTAVDGDVAIKHISFVSSSTTGVTLSAFAIDKGGSNIAIVGTAATAYTAGQVTVNVTFDTEEQITSGSSVTYNLKASVLGADTGDAVTTTFGSADTAIVTGDLAAEAAAQTLQDKDATNDIGDDYNNADTTPTLVWSDMSATGHDETADGTDDWTNSRNIKLPTDSQGLSL